jgi:hypothetical protein
MSQWPKSVRCKVCKTDFDPMGVDEYVIADVLGAPAATAGSGPVASLAPLDASVVAHAPAVAAAPARSKPVKRSTGQKLLRAGLFICLGGFGSLVLLVMMIVVVAATMPDDPRLAGKSSAYRDGYANGVEHRKYGPGNVPAEVVGRMVYAQIDSSEDEFRDFWKGYQDASGWSAQDLANNVRNW